MNMYSECKRIFCAKPYSEVYVPNITNIKGY